ncbi:MAG: phosphatase PAP2 family protein [Oligoflexia bacterium]|nr:phosphatase PAP2 family protein [Oligoflexia bacterium]
MLPALGVITYWLALLSLGAYRGGFRLDHLLLGAAILALSYGGRRALAFRRFLLPLLLTALIYDAQRFLPDFVRGAVHVSEPYEFDRRFFGIPLAGGLLTPNEWWQLNTHPLLDFLTGLAYLVFIAVFVGSAAYFELVAAVRGTASRLSSWIRPRASAPMWSFFWVNMLGYGTYHLYPAAPPWYVALHGFGPARLDVAPNPAGCARFDELLGTRLFEVMYGRSADVFGAIPSLHVAYPLITVYFAFRFGALRVAATGFYFWMCFSAVYLNHHYVLDVLWGSAYALAVAGAIDRYYERRLAIRREAIGLPLSA